MRFKISIIISVFTSKLPLRPNQEHFVPNLLVNTFSKPDFIWSWGEVPPNK